MTHHPRIQLAGTVTVGPKGQVVIPRDVREQMGIGPGDKLVGIYLAEKQTVGFISEHQAQEFVTKLGEKLTNIKEVLRKES